MSKTAAEKSSAVAPSTVRRWAAMERDDAPRPSFAASCLEHPLYGELLRPETYKAGQMIHPIGTPIKEFGIVTDGCLKGNFYTANGNELCNSYFEKDDVFPELLYFTGTKTYSYNLMAAKRSTVMWLETTFFELMLKTDHELMYRFMLYLSKRGLKNQMLLCCLRYQTIRERLVFWLLWMDSITPDDFVPLPSSQAIWANELRVSRSSLNQEIKRMEKLGCFRVQGHRLEILDRKALEELI